MRLMESLTSYRASRRDDDLLAERLLRDAARYAIARIHAMLGIDPNDVRTTHLYDLDFTDVAGKWFRPLAPNEDLVGNPLHLVSALGFAAFAIARRRRWDATARAAMAIGATAVAGWLLMQIAIKWQPWSSRYDLPFFAVLAVPLGVGLARLPARGRLHSCRGPRR